MENIQKDFGIVYLETNINQKETEPYFKITFKEA